jgi:zinc protease
MIRTICAGLAGLLLATPALAKDVTSFTLDNGLQVVVIEDHRAPVVTHMVWYRVGSADEEPGVSGIAHFLEHLMFKSTETMESGTFSETVSAQGGRDNAFTSWDYTAYFQRVAADRLDLMMQMEADRMRNLRLTEDDVTTERQVILEERSQRIDNDPGALLGEQRMAAQYQNHRYGIPIIGWRHEMEQLSREDALEFYRKYYAPNNAFVVVAGDVTPEAVRAMAEEHYGPLKPTPGLEARVRPTEAPQLAERRITLEDPRVAQPYVMRTYLAPERDSGAQEEAAALTVLAELLGGSGNSSVLARALTFGDAKATYVSAFYDGTALDQTTFGLVIVPAPGVSLDEAEAALDAAVETFLAEGVDPAAFARIKTNIRANEIYARDDSNRLARRYGEALATGLTIEDIQSWPEVLEAVTPDEVMAAAREVFDRRRAVTARLVQSEENAL